MKLWQRWVAMILLHLSLWSVYHHLKMMALSDGIVLYTRISACKDSKTVECYLHTQGKFHKVGTVCHCCFLPTWLASYPALHMEFELRSVWSQTSWQMSSPGKVVYFQHLSVILLHCNYTTYSTEENDYLPISYPFFFLP